MKQLKKIWDMFTTALTVCFVLLAVALVGMRLFGFQVFSVLSGSMEPLYHVGSLIYVKEVDYHELKSGDVITYMLSEDTVSTHRIVEVVPDQDDPAVVRYLTKGDANEAADGTLVHYKNVLGKPVFTIPYLGYVADFIQKPPGTYAAIAIGAVLLALMFLPDLFREEEPQKRGKYEKPPNAL